MTTTQHRPVALGEASVGELAQSVRGELLGPQTERYEEARSIWNAAHNRRPALILRAAGVADVIKGVQFARSENLVGAENAVTSSDLHVLVHETPEPVASEGLDGRTGGRGSAAGGRVLIK
jgi:hypothetical protein